MPIPTNECVMCGMSIPEDDIMCEPCAECDKQLLTDLENAMYEAEEEPEYRDTCMQCGSTAMYGDGDALCDVCIKTLAKD